MDDEPFDESELKKEAERLGWTIKYLEQHLAKEERIKKVFDNLRKNGD